MKYKILGIIFMAGALLKIIGVKDPSVPDKTVEQVEIEIADKKRRDLLNKEQFLKDMSQIESSGGKNTKHKTILSGIHEGQAAVGQFGLMPNTVEEISKRMEMEGSEPEEIRMLKITGTPSQEIANEVAKNPELERKMAERLYEHVKTRQGGDEERMNHAWQFGHNLKPEAITVEKLELSPRTEKFRKLRSKLK